MKLIPQCLALLLALPVVCAETSLPDWTIGPFTRPENAQPIIKPNPTSTFDCPLAGEPILWEKFHTFNPAAVVHQGRIHVLYRAEGGAASSEKTGIGGYISRLGMAISDDGVNFTTEPKPAYYPAADAQQKFEGNGGAEDPRVITGPNGTYVLLYTRYAGRGTFRLGLATSKDLRHWTKHGCPFNGSKFANRTGIKSASILQKVENGGLVAAQVNGKYWMYFGERAVHLAHSDDLVHWTPLEGEEGKYLQIMNTRPGYFDSGLVECGPPALLTDKGIILIYNGKNNNPTKDGDSELPNGVYTCGQALFDKTDPAKFITRLDKPFFKPELDWEKSGQYKGGTTFAEGLVLFKGKWFLYYGCADTFVGVANADASK